MSVTQKNEVSGGGQGRVPIPLQRGKQAHQAQIHQASEKDEAFR